MSCPRSLCVFRSRTLARLKRLPASLRVALADAELDDPVATRWCCDPSHQHPLSVLEFTMEDVAHTYWSRQLVQVLRLATSLDLTEKCFRQSSVLQWVQLRLVQLRLVQLFLLVLSMGNGRVESALKRPSRQCSCHCSCFFVCRLACPSSLNLCSGVSKYGSCRESLRDSQKHGLRQQREMISRSVPGATCQQRYLSQLRRKRSS